ncbi:chromosome segregation protein SMC [Polycyclovorans algicola]|uniref:chromosome segregation protein SMC n=1 Tax=Polycyclovorans algicola TaxID=616992 RepID=UPI0004A6F8F6|nr:chromosome segregation protein SMC [Polycyclovorans algicola]
MRLSGIKLAGFKSFVDPTQLLLPSNLTSVVGPNGCGKSNIIDAVRWVLGESSMKNLRGADAEDVIFNGSRTRKPIGRASVELLFDNSDGQITGTYAAYSEISVRRELSREGGSQYFLNGRKCLKRDVTDLFLGTGLGGKNQYAIIEQGMVSRMVEAKPDELRLWLEEAAGISKYKDRRRETESRIRATRENLDRLNDLRGEIDGRIQALTKQAANAEKYTALKADERRLRAELLYLRVRAVADESAEIATQIAAQQAAQASAVQSLAAAREAREQAERALREAETAINAEQARVFEAESERTQAQQTLAHTQALRDMQTREREELDRRRNDTQGRRDREAARRADADKALALLLQRLAEAEALEAEARRDLEHQEFALAEAQQLWEQFSQSAEAPLAKTESERVRVQALERARLQSEARLKRLTDEAATLDIDALLQALTGADHDAETLAASLAEGRARLGAMESQLSVLRDERRQDEQTLHHARQQLQDIKGRQASLETLQAAALRNDETALKQWWADCGLADAPKLAERIDVDAGWEAAVEHVLQAVLAAPVGDVASAGPPPTQGPERGAVILFDRSGATAPAAAAGAPLAAHVRGPAVLGDWLRDIEAVPDLAALTSRRSQLAAGQSCITADGIWAGRDWVRYPQRGQGQSGVIERRRQLKTLVQSRGDVEADVAALDARVGAIAEQIQALEAERRGIAQTTEQVQSRHAQKLAQQQSLKVRLEQTQQRAARLAQERQETEQHFNEAEAELADTRAGLAALEADAQRLRQTRGDHQQALAKARDALQRSRAAHQLAAQQVQRLAVERAGAESTLAALLASQQALTEQLARLDAQVGERGAQAEQWTEPLAVQTAAVTAAETTLAERRDALRGKRGIAEAAEHQLQAAQVGLQQAEQQREHENEAVQALLLKAESSRTRGEALEAQLAESGFTAEQVAATLAEDLTPPVCEEQLASVLRRIERLGAINLAAIQELEEAQARAQYFETQHADLSGALETLEAAMQKIDGDTKALFRDTFDRVNTVFRERFPKLFGGGEATLELIGDDLLNAGVRVMARPPGKRNATIQLLSGGEKAMTAVALLLGLFELNPAPFCLMDEVDAPLDDANVSRFCEVVREMSQNVQFIIITHNKITMELAQQLHGVTMQEPGVSRLVSVDVDQAVALTETGEAQAT